MFYYDENEIIDYLFKIPQKELDAISNLVEVKRGKITHVKFCVLYKNREGYVNLTIDNSLLEHLNTDLDFNFPYPVTDTTHYDLLFVGSRFLYMYEDFERNQRFKLLTGISTYIKSKFNI